MRLFDNAKSYNFMSGTRLLQIILGRYQLGFYFDSAFVIQSKYIVRYYSLEGSIDQQYDVRNSIKSFEAVALLDQEATDLIISSDRKSLIISFMGQSFLDFLTTEDEWECGELGQYFNTRIF